MKVSRTGAVLLTAVVLVVGVTADRAGAATTVIGAVSEVKGAELPSALAAGGFAVQVAESSGTYAVPSGYGTITAWSHSAGTTAGTLTFEVYRPTGNKQEFTVVGFDKRTVTARSVQTFPVQIPVLPGDRIGLSSDDVQLAYESSNTADRIGFFSFEPPLGATGTTDGEPFQEFKLDVTATLESNASGPGPGPGGEPTATPYPIATPRPTLTQLKVAPAAFKRGGRGARVRYRVNVASRVRFTALRARPGRRKGGRCVAQTRLNRNAPRCRRNVRVPGALTRSAKAGANQFRFRGRLGGRTLRPGSYVLVATPSAGTITGKAVRRSFRVTR